MAKNNPLGRKVRREANDKWEEGIIVLDKFEDSEEEYFIKFKEGDLEQLVCLPFEIWEGKEWIDGWDYFSKMNYSL